MNSNLIFEYWNAALWFFCDAINTGDMALFRIILAEDAVLESNRLGEEIRGTDRIIEELKDFHKHPGLRYVAHLAEIVENKIPGLEFKEGTKCVKLTDTEERYEALVLFTTNDEGKIERIKVSPGYGSLVMIK